MISRLAFYTYFEGFDSLTGLSFKIHIFLPLEAGNLLLKRTFVISRCASDRDLSLDTGNRFVNCPSYPDSVREDWKT